MSDSNLNLEAQAFNSRISRRNSNNFIPDLRNYKDNDFFYKSFWRRQKYSDIYVGTMARTYVSCFQKFLPKGSLLLDFGCGPGYFSLELARAGFNVVSYDIAETCIESASKYVASLGDKALSESLSFTSKIDDLQKFKYSGILCSGVLHHLPNLEEVLDSFSGLFLSPQDALLVFHEPAHGSWRKSDAFVTALIRLILSATNTWYDDHKVSSNSELEDLIDNVFVEYTTERDPQEKGGQSPNDLSCDFADISLALQSRFDYFESWPSRSFIYRTLGGLRSSKSQEDKLADLLEIIDSVGINNGYLKPNYMYGIARSLKSS